MIRWSEPKRIIWAATVTFEETGEKREVLRDCLSCLRIAGPSVPICGAGIVSPAGVAHIADGDATICGKDATGAGWWWPL